MYKSLSRLFIILFVANFSKAAENNEPPIDQDLPLVLIKTDKDILLPAKVDIITTGRFKKEKMIQFGFYSYFNQGFYCPSEDDEQRNKIVKAIEKQNSAEGSNEEKIDEHCLLKKKKTDAELAPQCLNSPHPKIMKAFRKNRVTTTENGKAIPALEEIYCGVSGTGKQLGFGYQVCFEHEQAAGFGKILRNFKEKVEVPPFKGTKEVILYGLCYSAATNEILYTTHVISETSLFSDALLEKDRVKIWPMKVYNSIHIPNIDFEEVKLKFEMIMKLSSFKIQLLVQPDDFAMAIWKKPAYHYANVGLIHEDLQQCWNSIHEQIRKYILKSWGNMDVLTGAFKLPETGDSKIIEGIQIPKIWAKIVHRSFSVVIMANNYRDGTVNSIITKQYNCKVNLCKRYIEKNFPNVLDDIRCCALTNEIQALFGTKLDSSGVQEIVDLIEINPEKPPNVP